MIKLASTSRGIAVLLISLNIACSGKGCGSVRPAAPSGSTDSAITRGPAVPLSTPLQGPAISTGTPTPHELVERITAVAHGLRPEWYSVEAQAKALGPGAGPAFTWVRDRVRYEAYSGVLRNAESTLAAAAGNAFDRSLLLARLLAAKGVRTRFVTGDLDRSQAELLFQRMFEGVETPRSGDRTAGASGMTGFLARVTTRARRDHPVILAALGPAFSAGAAQAREQAIADIQRHAWIQASMDGQWVDLDSSFGDADPGRTYCQASRTFDTVSPAWYQTVTIRVTAERVEDGVLNSTGVLEITRPAADLVNQRVFLVHVPAPGKGGTGLGAAGAVRGDRWAPALLVDEGVEAGRPIDFGDAESGSGFDALGGGGTSSLVAEWLEFEVTRPDGRRDTSRRTIVDRAGSAWRESKAHRVENLRPLPRNKDGLLAPGAVHHLMFSAGPHNLRRYGRAVVAAAFPMPADQGADPSLSTMLRPLAARNSAALVWTDDVIIPGLNDDPEVHVYSDSPRIAVVSLAPDPNGGVSETYDLRRDWVCGVARAAAADALVADRKIWFAALEGALEHESVARDGAMAGLDPSGVRSTSALLTADGVVALRAADLARLPEVTKDAETLARLGAVLRSGSMAVVPRSALASGSRGWWEVAPNGDTRAVLDGLNNAWINSGGGITPIRPAMPQTFNIGAQLPEAERARQIAQLLGEGEAAGAPAAEAGPAVASRGRGNEYTMLLTTMASVAIAVGTVVAVYLHHQSMARANAELEAWTAAEDAKQQAALAAARRQ